ncbi:pyridoxal phosphate-dependent aminotransferase [Actinophytocola sp.]|uniref:pyridoxal phosphate-dependent aminotransferase n=1 Tax=Actinophytocola sp. TaxID=1872138 RepID=UPI003D6C5E79
MPTLPGGSSTLRLSGIREIRLLAASMTDVIDLAVGEPDQNTPEAICEAAARATRAGFTKYTPANGLPSLRASLAEKLKRDNAIVADPSQITVGSGAVCSLSTSILATVAPGDEILVPDPGWPNYATMIRLAGGDAVRYPLSPADGFLPDVAQLEKLVSPRTRVLMINNPGNPTGAVFPPDLVRELVEFAAEYDLFLLSDEVYEDFVYEGAHAPAASFGYEEGIISVFSFSKSYAMTGWRLGYSVAARDVASAITKVQGGLLSCASTVSQKAGEAALALDPSARAAMREEYRTRRDAVHAELGDRLVLVPQGAFYALVDVSDEPAGSTEVARNLLAREHVAAVPGSAFGTRSEGMLRISFAAALDDVVEGCRRIARHLVREELGG